MQAASTPAPASSSDNDPLLKALQNLRSEIGQLKNELNGAPPSMSGTNMSAQPSAATAHDADLALGNAVLSRRRAALEPAPAPEFDAPVSAGDAGVHWSFRALRRPAVPAVKLSAWPKSDIDRFILARQEAAQVEPHRDADRPTLLRRVALDLTGLPPDAGAQTAFLADRASDDTALATVVDRLLDSPRFGERWARHWLDLVRYADSVGRSWNAPFTYAWRYRDYVIDAFNRDKPFDRFVLEQIAGDLLPAETIDEERETLVATGFLALGSMDLTAGRREQFILDQVDDQIDVSTRGFLGLTVSCARCHDHKYDPVSMRDYYALAGVFYSTETWTGNGLRWERVANGYVDPDRLLRLPAAPGAAAAFAESGVHSMTDFTDELRGNRNKQVRYTTHPHLAMGVCEGEIGDCELRIQGEPYDRGEAPPRGDLHIPGLPKLPVIPAGASGRLEFARWVASPANPLTARVFVNRVWQHLLGRGLVATVDDFGTTGETPSHPELLDHLAVRFVEEGWSIKKLVREIILSRVYRLDSTGHAAAGAIDPQNNLYWRMHMRRLEFEALRDSMLQASGWLRFERPAGIQVAGSGGKGTGNGTHSLLGIDAACRTVYLPVLRSLMPEAHSTFDVADPCQISGQRVVTTVAPQALFFMNSDFAAECAKETAAHILNVAAKSDSARVDLAYRRILARAAHGDEIRDALAFLKNLKPPANEPNPLLYAWAAFVQTIFAGAEFRYAL